MLRSQITTNEQLQSLIVELKTLTAGLQQQIETLLKQLYGKKSERKPKELLAPPSTIEPPTPPVKPTLPSTGKKTSPTGRRPLPPHLQRERVEYDLPNQQKACQCCGGALHKFGEEVSEQLEFVAAKLIAKSLVRFKYACRSCGNNVKIASMPLQPIDKGLPGPGLLAEVLVNKYQDALPLYSQEKR